MDINEKVIMSLETYNKLLLENATLKQKVGGIFELEPIYNDDNHMSVALSTKGQALYEEFSAEHPEYKFASPRSVSFYSVATKIEDAESEVE